MHENIATVSKKLLILMRHFGVHPDGNQSNDSLQICGKIENTV